MSSPNQYESGLALNGLACFVTPDIVRDLAGDLLTIASVIIKGYVCICKMTHITTLLKYR